MRYLCLVYGAGEAGGGCGPDPDEHRAYQEALHEGGYYIAASPLPPCAAATVRVRSGTVLVEDGSADPAREQIGGFYLIDARDLNDAIRVVARMPLARSGSIEIRAVQGGDDGAHPLRAPCPAPIEP